jgi:hypothetical protein
MKLAQWKQDRLAQEVMEDTVEAMVVMAVETVVDAENTNFNCAQKPPFGRFLFADKEYI